VAEQRRSVGGADSGGVNEILVRDRQPVQQTWCLAAGQRLVGGRRLRHGLAETPGDHRVDGAVHRLDALDVCRDHLPRRNLPAAQHPGQRDRVVVPQSRHQPILTHHPGATHPSNAAYDARVLKITWTREAATRPAAATSGGPATRTPHHRPGIGAGA
jgi:hypothetical protein